jgi:hypothetical protein
MYDVYYTTGFGNKVGAGSDVWVNNFVEYIVPHLKVKPILLIHRKRPDDFEGAKFPLEIYWQVDDKDKFDELINSARRIHILHGHYYPNSAILNNLDKIESYVMHNSIDMSLKAGLFSDSPGMQHYGADSEWENNIIEKAKKRIWIGLFKTPKHIEYDFIDIPNYYDFQHNLELSDSTKVGFAARTETRKRVWYLENIDSYLFTTIKVLNNVWEKGYGVNFKRAKRYMFDYNKLDWFYRLDWGISHSCFNYEPFGYSIFQAVDYGKLPILSKDWMKEWNYPFRAETKTEFEQTVQWIKNSDYEYKKHWFNKLKEYMLEYSDRNKWVDNLLDIYNS